MSGAPRFVALRVRPVARRRCPRPASGAASGWSLRYCRAARLLEHDAMIVADVRRSVSALPASIRDALCHTADDLRCGASVT